MSSKKIILVIVFILILMGGLGVGILLVQQSQIFHEKASTPTGQTTVSISPATGTYNLGQSYPISVYFNTAGIPISAIAVRLTYPYSGSSPEIVASDPIISPALISTGDWACTVKKTTVLTGSVEITIACVNTNTSGFSASTDTLLATFNINAGAIPLTNPTLITFDATQSIITQKSNGQDVLLTPSGVASIRVAGATIVPTATATTTATATATATATSFATSTATSTATAHPTATATATGTSQVFATSTPIPTGTGVVIITNPATNRPIPVSGNEAPTIIMAIVGLLFVLGASLLVIL